TYYLVLLRGDHQLHETKLSDTLGTANARAATADEILALLGANPGSLGAVDVGRDIKVDQWADLRTVNAGEECPQCENGKLEVSKALEIGHIFKLGTKYC